MLKILTLLVSLMIVTAASAGQLCHINFSHDHKDVKEVLMEEGSFHHELWIAGVKQPMKIVDEGPNIKSTVSWWSEEPCPPCEWIRMRTVHVVKGESEWSNTMCYSNPNKPDACQ